MTIRRRSAVTALVAALVGAACAAETPVDVLVSERSEGTETPAPSSSDVERDDPTASPLNIATEAAVLLDHEIPPPWDPSHRYDERPGHGAGPNQTDCAPYWEYERLQELPNAGAMWWRDGGNLNHQVFRAENAAAATAFVAGMRRLEEDCPVTSWGEGDAFRIAALDLGDDEIVGLEFVQPTPEEVHHVAITAREDLISVIWIVQWPPFDGTPYPHTTVDDLASHARLARDRLLGAERVPTPATTAPPPSTTEPGTAPDVTTSVRPPPITLPPESTLPPDLVEPPGPPPTLVEPPDQVAAQMLDTEDIWGSGWEAGTPHRYETSDSDPPFDHDCPALEAATQIERVFVWEKDLFVGDTSRGAQFIGEMESDQAAAALVVDFGRLAECDVSEWLAGGSASMSPLDIADASATVVLSLRLGSGSSSEDGAFARIYLLAVGTTVTGLTFEFDGIDDDIQTPTRIAEAAAAKIAER